MEKINNEKLSYLISETNKLSDIYTKIIETKIKPEIDSYQEKVNQLLSEAKPMSLVISNLLKEINLEELSSQDKQLLVNTLNTLFYNQAITIDIQNHEQKTYDKIIQINELREKLINTDTKPLKS